MHRRTPGLRFDNPQVHLKVILYANRSLRAALRKNGLDERHREKRLHCFFEIRGGGKNIDVVNDLFHSPEAPAKSDAIGVTFEIFAELLGDRERPAEKVIAATATENLDTFEDVVDRLLFEPRHAEQLLRLAKRFQVFDRLNPKEVVDLLGGLRTDTRNLDHLGQTERDILLQLFVEFDPPGAD